MSTDVFSHTQLNVLQMLITWQLVSNSIVGHHQTVVQAMNAQE